MGTSLPVTEEWTSPIFASEARFAYHLSALRLAEIYATFVRRIDARIPVIFVTVAKTADDAIEAMRRGAYDYLFKPLDLGQLKRVVGEALEVARLMRAPAVVAEAEPYADAEGAIIGGCPAMREVYKAIGAETHREVDRLLLRLVPEYTRGNQHQAAHLLGVARQTLRQKLRDLGMHVTRAVEADEDDPS